MSASKHHPNPTKRNPTVSIHFASMTVSEITDRAHTPLHMLTRNAIRAAIAKIITREGCHSKAHPMEDR